MRKIVLNTATTDRRGGYRDAGETLTVGAAANADTDLTTEAADALLAGGAALPATEAAGAKVTRSSKPRTAKSSRKPAKAAGREPLDHDGDGRKGGSAPAQLVSGITGPTA